MLTYSLSFLDKLLLILILFQYYPHLKIHLFLNILLNPLNHLTEIEFFLFLKLSENFFNLFSKLINKNSIFLFNFSHFILFQTNILLISLFFLTFFIFFFIFYNKLKRNNLFFLKKNILFK
jgi:hypothetical protein